MRVQLLIGASLCLMLAACDGGSIGSNSRVRTDCATTGIAVDPATATADHSAASPGNTARFSAEALNDGRCPTPQLLPDWTVSDTTNVSIVSAKDPATNGTATCLNETSAPVTVTATTQQTGKTFTATAQLTCN
jgi:hypothetical protein